MRRSYLTLAGVTAGWGTIPVLAGLVHVPSTLIVAIRLWTAAICLGGAILWRDGRARRLGLPRRPALFSFRPEMCVVVAGVLAAHWLALANKHTDGALRQSD